MGPMHHLPELSGLLSPALHYSPGTVLPVSPLRLLLPSQKPWPGGGEGGAGGGLPRPSMSALVTSR